MYLSSIIDVKGKSLLAYWLVGPEPVRRLPALPYRGRWVAGLEGLFLVACVFLLCPSQLSLSNNPGSREPRNAGSNDQAVGTRKVATFVGKDQECFLPEPCMQDVPAQ